MPARHGWGGARKGAGKKPGPRPLTTHQARDTIRAPHPVHISVRFKADLPTLAGDVFFDVLLWALRRTSGSHGTRFCGYAAQGDHLHLVAEAESAQALGQAMTALGGCIARVMNRILDRRGPVFHGRYHAHILETPTEVLHALVYLVENAARHASRAGRATRRSILDPYASLGAIPLGPHSALGRRATGPAATDPPRTWLLSTGWHRSPLRART